MNLNRAYFEIDLNGLAIGYHCEGGETFDNSGKIPLSMETLDNSRFLFMGNDAEEWLPRHLNLQDYRLYRIAFELPKKVMTFDNWDDYHNLFDWCGESNKYLHSNKLKQLIKEGYNLFILNKNVQDELTESFLINPRQYVKHISELAIC